MVKISRPLVLGLVTLLFFACKEEIVPDRYRPNTLHAQYWYSLKTSNLLNTALGEAWENASQYAFDQQNAIDLPYTEAFQFDAKEPGSVGYKIEALRGQRIMIQLDQLDSIPVQVFMDLFRIDNDSLGEYRHVASADSLGNLGFEPRNDAKYILRVQPELLRGGYFQVSITQVPTLAFPVAGRDVRAIQSFFGDPRDGGKREHHGVDIFAPRHTPIIAPTEAYVRFVGERGLGGNVIWLRDSKRNQSLYFAHLQEQLVESHTYVQPGDTIGTVGNTGNARYTPPHLHFGIYKNGPLDPYNHIVKLMGEIPEFEPNLSDLGRKGILTSESDTIDVLGVNHRYLRVKLADNREQLVPKSSVQLF